MRLIGLLLLISLVTANSFPMGIVENEEEKCAVCWCPISKEDISVILGCEHIYHGLCMKGTLEISNLDSCPTCRTDVPKEQRRRICKAQVMNTIISRLAQKMKSCNDNQKVYLEDINQQGDILHTQKGIEILRYHFSQYLSDKDLIPPEDLENFIERNIKVTFKERAVLARLFARELYFKYSRLFAFGGGGLSAQLYYLYYLSICGLDHYDFSEHVMETFGSIAIVSLFFQAISWLDLIF